MNIDETHRLTLLKDNMPTCDKNKFFCSFHTEDLKEALLELTQCCVPIKQTDSLSNKKKLPKQPPARHSEKDAKDHNAMMVDNYKATIRRIQSMHHFCENYIPWDQIAQLPPYTPLNEKGPSELRACLEIKRYNPNLFQRMTKKHHYKKQFLQANLSRAKADDKRRIELKNALIELASAITQGHFADYLRIVLLLDPFNDLLALGSEVTIIGHDKDLLEVTFYANSEDVVPKRILSLSPTHNVVSNTMTHKFYHELVQDYVCSCALRIARELFAITPVKRIIVHAQDQHSENTSDGFRTLLSVSFTRSKLLSLDFLNIDPSDSMAQFEHRMEFKTSEGLNHIEKLIP